MTCPLSRALAALALAALVSAPARADKLIAELDFAAHGSLLKAHFAGYGHVPGLRQTAGMVQVRLPSRIKGVGQTGFYSYFALAGDFEVAAMYQLVSMPAPKTGYGVSCGIAVECPNTGASVTLARSRLPNRRNGYTVTRGQKSDTGMKYETDYFPGEAATGRLVLRREQAELICLVAEGEADPVREVCRVPFPDGTVRPLRLFADAGGSPTEVNVRLSQIRVRAEEITGGIPQRDRSQGLGWLVAGLAMALGGGLAFWFVRRRRSG